MSNLPPGVTEKDIDNLYDDSLALADYSIICDWLTGILEAMYVTGNTDELENCLDELCSYFEMKLPKEEILLTKKEEKDA